MTMRVATPLPSICEPAGIGLRTPHYRQFLDERPSVGFIEVHSENFFGRGGVELGGQAARLLMQARRDYPLSLHGVGMSLGSVEPVSVHHLEQLRQLVVRYEPQWVSEHLSWSGFGGSFANDLLPLPYTEEALGGVADNVQRVQDALKRPLLMENPSRYLAFKQDEMSETEFLRALIRRTGCRLLLDINNVYVSASNLGLDAQTYLEEVDAAAVAEIHLAGFSEMDGLLIDTHGQPVFAPVWDLYEAFLVRHGDRPTLIEWDTEIPALDVLLNEADTANRYRRTVASLSQREADHARTG